MDKQFSVRYGRNYKVVLAIVLPCLWIVPFILLLSAYPTLDEWILWLIIVAFLGLIIFTSIWLVMRVYPPTVMRINKNEIRFTFDQSRFLSPSDFSFYIADISTFTRGEIGGTEYFVFEIGRPVCKFQVSASSYQLEDMLSFNEVMAEISEKLQEMPHGRLN